MLRISDTRLDALLQEDVPYIDLTTEILGIADREGEIEYFTREDCLLCGTEEVKRIMEKLDIEVAAFIKSGTPISAGTTFLKATGFAGNLHQAWKVCLNIFDTCSAVATKTYHVVQSAKSTNPKCEILTTRKSMPGTKDLLTKAVMAGGAFPHRLGLSETVLIFDHHISFFGGFEKLLEQLPKLRCCAIEKKLFVEANAPQARLLAAADIDGIQLDKIPLSELAALVEELRGINPRTTLIAAGGITPENAREYAATGVDGLVTSSLFSARPIDMSVRMTAF